MKKFLLILTAMIFTCSIAYGTTWKAGENFKKVLEKYDGSASYIDVSSISKTGDLVTFDMVINYINNKENVDYSEQTLIYNCATREWKMLRLIDYLNNGTVHRTPEGFLAKLPFQKASTSQDVQAYFNFVCK